MFVDHRLTAGHSVGAAPDNHWGLIEKRFSSGLKQGIKEHFVSINILRGVFHQFFFEPVEVFSYELFTFFLLIVFGIIILSSR